MTDLLFLATGSALAVARRAGESWQVVGRGLVGRRVTSVIAREGVILAGTTEGVFRSDDEGVSWQAASAGLAQPYVRWLAYHPDVSDCEFAGTEPAGIYMSRDGAATWRACPEVALLRDRHGWSLPYSPNAGCVRGFAFRGSRGYAAVEVGGVLRSDDGGETWRLAAGSSGDPSLAEPPAPLVYPDVHAIAAHPSSPDLVHAATGAGLYRSLDGGAAWTRLYDCYCRALWVDPADPQHVVFGPADGVDRNGRIEESRDGGQTWQPASDGLDLPWPGHMVERLAEVGGALLAVLSNGELWSAAPAAPRWQRILAGVTGVAAVASWPG